MAKRAPGRMSLQESKQAVVLANNKNVKRLSRILEIKYGEAKRLLSDPKYFQVWVKEQEAERMALSYAFINQCLRRMKKNVSETSFLGMSKAFGIASDKLIATRAQQPALAQQINIGEGTKVSIEYPQWHLKHGRKARKKTQSAQ